MAAWIAVYLAVPAVPLVFLGIVLVLASPSGSEREARGDGLLAIGLGIAAVAEVLNGDWLLAAVNGPAACFAAWLWWRNRKRRDRAPRSYGYKARAALAALVAKARESARPRPVLRPAPGGAG